MDDNKKYKYFENIRVFLDRYEDFIDKLCDYPYESTVEEDNEFYNTLALRIATAICCDFNKDTANCIARAILANNPDNK